MELVTSKLLANSASLSREQQETARIGLIIAQSGWAAAMAHVTWEQPSQRLHNRCIYGTMLSIDVAHRLGWTEAEPFKCGLHIGGRSGLLYRQLVVGAPDAPKIPRMINAHAVMRIGDIIIDPTLAQTRRPWNDLPHIGAVIANSDENQSIEILSGCRVPVIAQANMFSLRGAVQLSYFKLPRTVERATRNWMDLPDVRPCRRREIVEAALAIARSRLAEAELLAA